MVNTTCCGYLTKDATLAQSVSCCNFDIACDTAERGEDGKQKTLFVRVSIWGKRGEYCAAHLKKGDFIVVSGDQTIREYVDRNGEKRYSVCVNAASIGFGPRRNPSPAQNEMSDDELPM